jgi:hypothetical protein
LTVTATPFGNEPEIVSAADPVDDDPMLAVIVAATGFVPSHPAASAAVRRLTFCPPAIEKAKAFAFPYPLLREMAPLATPNSVRTPLSAREIMVLEAMFNSTFTSLSEIAPEAGSVMSSPQLFL